MKESLKHIAPVSNKFGSKEHILLCARETQRIPIKCYDLFLLETVTNDHMVA